MNKICLYLIMITACTGLPFVRAEETESKKSATQQVGGLLFEVDEGVKLEQGPGGSVYMKSNKEYMQQKFNEIDRQFKDLEQRVAILETRAAAAASSSVKTSEGPAAAAEPPANDSKNRVLST